VEVGVDVGSGVLVGVAVYVAVRTRVGSLVFVGDGSEVAVFVGVDIELIVSCLPHAVKSMPIRERRAKVNFAIVLIGISQINGWLV
jgi:hypothetical protein